MLTSKDVAVVYETLLTSPGMGEMIRLDIKVARKTVLVLAKIIEVGAIKRDESESSFLRAFDAGSMSELSQISNNLLDKAGLSDLYTRLNALEKV